MKFFKTIRFDPSDTRVFDHAAEPDEWAVPGGFLFAAGNGEDITGKRKQAFSNGFCSIASLGHSTFVSVAEITEMQIEQLEETLAGFFIDQLGAPDRETALAAARVETGFVLETCAGLQLNTIMTVHRFFDDEGNVREEFRMVDAPGAKPHARVWQVVED